MMTDSEVLATINLTSLQTANAVKRELEAVILRITEAQTLELKESRQAQTRALMEHDVTCSAKDDIAALLRTVGYTTEAPDDTVHRRIQKVERTLWKYVIFFVGSAGIGGISGKLFNLIFGG